MVEFVDRKGKGKHPQPRKPVAKKRDVNVTCKHCAHAFTFQAAVSDVEATCPECSKPTGIPRAETKSADPEEKPAATLKAPRKQTAKPTPPKRPESTPATPTAPAGAEPATAETPDGGEAAATDGKPAPVRKTAAKHGLTTKPKCPECGTSMEKEAVICISCGHDTRSEETVTKPTMVPGPRKTSYVVPIAVSLILICGTIYYLAVVKKASPSHSPSPEVPSPEEPAPLSVAEPESPSNPEPQAEPAPLSEPEPAPTETQELPPAEIGETPDLRQRIIDRLDVRQPLYETGDAAVLTTRDDKTFRGKIIEINETAVRLYFRGSEGEVPIRALSSQSRSQIDSEYREQLIDSLVERYQETNTN